MRQWYNPENPQQGKIGKIIYDYIPAIIVFGIPAALIILSQLI